MNRVLFIATAIAGLVAAFTAAANAQANGAIGRDAAIVADVTITPSCLQESLVCGLTPRAARHR